MEKMYFQCQYLIELGLSALLVTSCSVQKIKNYGMKKYSRSPVKNIANIFLLLPLFVYTSCCRCVSYRWYTLAKKCHIHCCLFKAISFYLFVWFFSSFFFFIITILPVIMLLLTAGTKAPQSPENKWF